HGIESYQYSLIPFLHTPASYTHTGHTLAYTGHTLDTHWTHTPHTGTHWTHTPHTLDTHWTHTLDTHCTHTAHTRASDLSVTPQQHIRSSGAFPDGLLLTANTRGIVKTTLGFLLPLT